MAGRQPKPVSVILLDGKKHLTKKEIADREKLEAKYKPKADNIVCPKWLDADAKKQFKFLKENLTELGLLTNIDILALAICCDAYSKYLEATGNIKGLVIMQAGEAKANPFATMANKYSEIYKKYCTEFGLTPAARLKIAQPKKAEPPKSKFDRFGMSG